MYSLDQRMNGPFLPQVFIEELGKVSNKGWQIHQRVLELDKDTISYFSKVPKNFHPGAKAHLTQANKNRPKYKIDLRRVRTVGPNEPTDEKHSKKLKNAKSFFFKIEFTGLQQQAQTGSQKSRQNQSKSGDKKIQAQAASQSSEEEQIAADPGQKKVKNTGSTRNQKEKNFTWFFQCQTEERREELLSKIYMNCMMKFGTAGLRERQIELQSKEITLQIVRKYIQKMELSNKMVIADNFNQLNQQGSNEQLMDSNDVLKNGTQDEDDFEEVSEDFSDAEEEEIDKELSQQNKPNPQVNNIGIIPQAPKSLIHFDIATESSPFHMNNEFINQVDHQKVKQELNFDQILKQNININKKESRKEREQEIKDREKDEDDEAVQFYQKIENLYKLEMNLEQEKQEIESKGWDLKFQNYWGYIISARHNHEQTMNMCEKLFKHVGQFRVHSENHFKNIIDNLHIAKHINQKGMSTDDVESLEEWDKLTNGLQPCPEDLLTADVLVLLDEVDDILYQTNIEENEHLSRQSGTQLSRNIYFHDNIIFKITDKSDEVCLANDNYHDYSDQKDLELHSEVNLLEIQQQNSNNCVNRQSNASNFSISTKEQRKDFIKKQRLKPNRVKKWKLYGKQFLSMDTLFDHLFAMSTKDQRIKMRIPLSSLIDYKGFRCLAIGKIPTEQHIYSDSDIEYLESKFQWQNQYLGQAAIQQQKQTELVHTPEVKQALSTLGKLLHLKENQVASTTSSCFENIPVSYFMQVLNYDSSERTDVKQNQSEPAQKSARYHFNELDYMDDIKLHYIVKSSEIFPVDCISGSIDQDCKNQIQFDPNNWLRPEFTNKYDHKYLSADCFKKYTNLNSQPENFQSDSDQVDQIASNSTSIEVHELTEASNFLKKCLINELVQRLDDLQLVPIDSESLTHIMHQYGVNLRYLSHIAVLTQVPHVRDICVTEMTARAFKNIVNQQSSQLIIEKQQTIYQQNKNDNSDQILQKPDELHKESIIQIVDILNLALGAGDETEYFWQTILIPECNKQFQIQEAIKYHDTCQDQLIFKERINLNAFFFAVISLLGLEIKSSPSNQNQYRNSDSNEQDPNTQSKGEIKKKVGNEDQNWRYQSLLEYYKRFGKDENPFGDPQVAYQIFEIRPRSKTFHLTTTPFRQQFGQLYEQIKNQKIEEALRSAHMKMQWEKALHSKLDLVTVADLADLAIEQGQFEEAIEYCEDAIKQILPLHAERIRFYCILLRAYFNQDKMNKAENYFQLTIDTIVHHLGPSHPLHITVYAIMAQLLIPKGKWEETLLIYKESMSCCLKSLGPNHAQTAQLHLDFGQFFKKWSQRVVANDQRDRALAHFEQAYMIYECHFERSSNQKNPSSLFQNSEVLGDVAMQVACIMEEQNRLNDAKYYVDIAYNRYKEVYGECSDNTIIAQWLMLQIVYSQSKQLDETVIEMADQLFGALLQRDQKIFLQKKSANYEMQNAGGQASNPVASSGDELAEDMTNIKILCIAVHIMEMTRRLSNQQKQMLEGFCDQIMLQKKLNDGSLIYNYRSLQAYKKSNIDLLSIRKVSSLPIKYDKKSELFFVTLYKKMQKQQQMAFKDFYKTQMEIALKKVDGQIKQKVNLRNTIGNNFQKQNNLEDFDRGQDAQNNTFTAQNDNRFISNRQQYGDQIIYPFKNEDRITQDSLQDDNEIFFDELLDAFFKVNFYNLLQWRHGAQLEF